MALIATPGASDANSYATEEEAEAYFENRLHASTWASASDTEQPLITSTSMLDWYMKWMGVKMTSTQALEWPRADVYDYNGYLIDNTIIPQRVKEAVFELALFSLAEDRLAEGDMAGFSKIKVGPLALESDGTFPKSTKKSPIPKHIRVMLSDYVVNPPGIARLIRG